MNLPLHSVVRLGMTLWFAALWFFLKMRERLPLRLLDWLLFLPPAFCLAALAAATGGSASPLAGGLVVLVVARTMLVPGSAMAHLPILSVLVASYPVALLVFGPHRFDLLGWLSDTRAMGYLAANLFPLVAAASVGLVGADLSHRMHQRLVSARSLGRYKLRKELARGAMGVVYLAWHRELGRPCVVKLVHPDQDSDKSIRRRFEREARETSQLRSPFTVQVFDFGITQNGELFYVMEFLEGDSLQEMLDRTGPLPAPLIARWLSWACESLAEAHARGLIHRDIKPANLFITRTGDGREVLKVLDFGIARKLGDGPAPRRRQRLPANPSLTAVGTIMGTPLYVAPEVLDGLPATGAADQYSLAATAYHLLTGQPCFSGKDLDELLANTLEEDPTPMNTVHPGAGIPPDLDSVILRALSKNPGARFESMEALRQALEPFVAAASAMGVSSPSGLAS